MIRISNMLSIEANKAISAALGTLLTVALTIAFVAPSWAQEAPQVNVIEVKGLSRIDQGSVRAKISHNIGEPLDADKVTEDIQEIYKMGYFDDVRVEVEPFEGGVRLIYIVREKPVLARIDFQGNKKFNDEKLRERLTISPGSIADTALIQQSAAGLKALYSSKGYSLAEVVPVVRRVSESQAVLTFQIDEGTKIKIKKIVVKGNDNIRKGKIKNSMDTGKWWLLSFLWKKGYYEKNRLAADIEKIKDLYYDNGYIQVVVEEPEIELTKNRKKMIITIKISEGDQFNISSIDIAGNTIFTEEQLREKMQLEAGEVFSKGKLEGDIETYSDMYGERGYAAVNVIPDVIPDETAKTVSVTYRIIEGEIYNIGKVHIAGNIKTRDKVIRREVRMNEGDQYNSKLLKRSYQRLNNTQYFEELKMLPRLRHREKEVDIDIDVKERKTGSISLGAGYSSIDSLVGSIEFKQGNFRGAGQKLNIKAELGSVANEFSVSFIDPWFLDYPVAFSASIFNTDREYVDYSREAYGFSLGLGKELGEYWSGSMLYSLDQSNITDIGPTASKIILDQAGKRVTSSITTTVARDTRDNTLDTHRGSRNSAVLTYAGIGGDNYFVKVKLDSQWYFPLSEKLTLALRGRYGHVTGLGGKQVPLYERFYVGGIYTIRGLDFGEAGPRDETGDVIGGRKSVIFNTDLVFPLYEGINLNGVVFFDAGSAYDGSLDEIRYTTGFGFRWLSPMGPIRLEWGKNLDPKYNEAASRWEFALGAFF